MRKARSTITLFTDLERPSFRIIGDYYARAFRELGLSVEELQTPRRADEREQVAASVEGQVVFFNTLGERFVPLPDRLNVALPVHEWSRYPRPWVRLLDRFDSVWVTTPHVRSVLLDSGLGVEAKLLPPPLDWEFGDTFGGPKLREMGKPFQFLSIGAAHFRKGHHLLLQGFELAFPEIGEAELTIKTGADCDWVSARPDVRFVREDWDLVRLRQAYWESDAYVSASLGEGLGLPVAEAILSRLPLCVNQWGGYAGLISKGGFLEISHQEIDQPFSSRPEFYAEGQKCCFSSPEAIAKSLREMVALSLEERSRLADTAYQSFQAGPYSKGAALGELREELRALGLDC